MTATATHTSQAVAEWTKVFPKQIIENYTSSVTFMKQLTVIAVSTITYLKNAFPEDSYTLETFGGLKLRVLKKKCRDELAHFLSTALTQAFEAFDKKYLHQLALCFYEEECKMENLIEYHMFEFSYNEAGVSMSVQSNARDSGHSSARFTFDGVRERTVNLIRACVVIMQTCQNHLPETYDVSLRLYYNENAPEGYQAPGFNPAAESDDHLEPTLGEAIKLGWVETPHHKLIARSYIKDSMGSSHEAIPSQNPPMMSQMEHEEFTSPVAGRSSTSSERPIRCPCARYVDDASEVPMLTCQYCNTVQHAACFGLMDDTRPEHCCTVCSDEDPTRVPTDPRLVDLSAKKRECLCTFRRTLWLSRAWGAVSGSRLAARLAVSRASAAKLTELLHAHGLIQDGCDTDLITPQTIIPERLKEVMNKFFQVTEEETIVDRLLAETFASQESRPDPVGDVLGPMEKVSLRNESNHGRIIEPEVNETSPEDITLKQYKEAFLSNYKPDEDLPVAGNPMKEIQNLGRKRIVKRKITDENEENRPKLRTGVRTKRAKTKA